MSHSREKEDSSSKSERKAITKNVNGKYKHIFTMSTSFFFFFVAVVVFEITNVNELLKQLD